MTDPVIDAAIQVHELRKNGQHAENGSGKPSAHPTSAEYIITLESMGYRFAFNELTQCVEVNRSPITDQIAAQIRSRMRDALYKPMTPIEDAYISHALKNSYHPIKDYLNALTWNGSNQIELLASYLEDSHAPFDDGTTVCQRFIRRWLIGSVGKVFNQHQLPMLILEGPQNLGKSYLIRWLASPLLRYFVEGPIRPEDKDSLVRLMSSWIWEVSELGATIRRSDVEALKAFITLRDVTVRRAYARYDTHAPAVASLIGTLNDTGAGFLNDTTGNRRALTISLRRIDWNYTQAVDVHQLWAQAIALYRVGESPTLTHDETAMQYSINADFELTDPVDDVLSTLFEIEPAQMGWITPTAEVLRLVDSELKGQSATHARAIAASLKKHGITAARLYVNGARCRGYRGIRPRDMAMRRLETQEVGQIGTDRDR